ncbi:hypothetical protein PHAVU_001G255000 [Phaseolus vulgaris]|uniref:Uncharacterized protein n=1 Tax=Phaseolus vulgaris TaxID=3885 RepID=V7CZZ4_PHAVU|nr:hypothetical protein PHAVU_001G255000g [Phaseolus vulgaris]ESW35674.1 hypothetical protein PHAVU_001G255000g [Phaseolus vulgaris]
MRRSLVFQQKYYDDSGTWMQTQSQQQSYTFHQHSWSSDNHKPFPEMSKHHHGKLGATPKKRFGGFVFQEGMHMQSDHGFGHAHHGGGRKSSYRALDGGGGSKFNSGHEYFLEETKCEEVYAEEHYGSVTAKVKEMRYQHQNWGDRNKVMSMKWWTTKGL